MTPLRWAKWLVREFRIVSKWVDGATVCDPTAGQGVFVQALMDEAAQIGISVSDETLQRLFLIERESRFIRDFHSAFQLKYSRDFPKNNTLCTDIVLLNPRQRFEFLLEIRLGQISMTCQPLTNRCSRTCLFRTVWLRIRKHCCSAVRGLISRRWL